MINNGFLFLFVFIVIIGIILVSDTLATALLIVSLLTNFVVLSLHLGKIRKIIVGQGISKFTDASPAHESAQNSDKVNSQNQVIQNPETDYAPEQMYQDSYIVADNFKDSYFTYESPKLCAVSTTGIDNANVTLNRAMQRDRKCFDGLATKNAKFFVPNFGQEFVDSENKIWWDLNN